MSSLIPLAAGAAKEAGNIALDLSKQQVIGVTQTTVRQSKRKTTVRTESLSIQAWEAGVMAFGLGSFALAAGLYQYLTGQSLMAAINSTLTNNPLPPNASLLGSLDNIVTHRPGDVSPTGRTI